MSNYIEYLRDEGMLSLMSKDRIFSDMVAEYQGTCDGMADEDFEWLEEHGLLESFDSELFLCVDCSWWCETSQLADIDDVEQHCQECHEYD